MDQEQDIIVTECQVKNHLEEKMSMTHEDISKFCIPHIAVGFLLFNRSH